MVTFWYVKKNCRSTNSLFHFNSVPGFRKRSSACHGGVSLKENVFLGRHLCPIPGLCHQAQTSLISPGKWKALHSSSIFHYWKGIASNWELRLPLGIANGTYPMLIFAFITSVHGAWALVAGRGHPLHPSSYLSRSTQFPTVKCWDL